VEATQTIRGTHFYFFFLFPSSLPSTSFSNRMRGYFFLFFFFPFIFPLTLTSVSMEFHSCRGCWSPPQPPFRSATGKRDNGRLCGNKGVRCGTPMWCSCVWCYDMGRCGRGTRRRACTGDTLGGRATTGRAGPTRERRGGTSGARRAVRAPQRAM
jgi:hypothetical protein